MSSDSSHTARSIKHLTIAVWALSAAVIGLLVFSILSWVYPPPYAKPFLEAPEYRLQPSSDTLAPPQASSPNGGRETRFYDLTVDEKIERASMIAVAEYQEGEDGQMRAIITEILKQSPGTESYYHVGDEHPLSSSFRGSEGFHNDKLVIFFTGSPATMKYSTGFDGDRVSGLGDMPLALLREKCSE